MKIVIAPDSYKGSLTSSELCQVIARAARDVMSNCEAVYIPIADGGEGTVDSVLLSCQGERIRTIIHDPLGKEIEAEYGIFDDMHGVHSAIIESAAGSGLTLIDSNLRDGNGVLRRNTYGTGEQILDAIKRGCQNIYIGLGGTGTNDCGMGFAAALGAKFYDSDGGELAPIPLNMGKVSRIDLRDTISLLGSCEDERSASEPREGHPKITLLCDVTNPLLGQLGATYIYGPQKGVTDDMLLPLDRAMESYIGVLEEATGRRVRDMAGAGAAGGLGACIMALAASSVRSGAEILLELADFGNKLIGADLAITGEGKMDHQSSMGKATCKVANVCMSMGVPCVAIVGKRGEGAEAMFAEGITRILEIAEGLGLSIEESNNTAEELVYDAAKRLFTEFYLDYASFAERSDEEAMSKLPCSRRKEIHVVAAVIREGDKIFACSRGYGDYEGWWEFPGGKIEVGEEPEEALSREILEELNTKIEVGELIKSVSYDYPKFHITMDCYWARVVSGELELLEAGDSRWLSAQELDSVRWLPSDIEVIALIRNRL